LKGFILQVVVGTVRVLYHYHLLFAVEFFLKSFQRPEVLLFGLPLGFPDEVLVLLVFDVAVFFVDVAVLLHQIGYGVTMGLLHSTFELFQFLCVLHLFDLP
jgi:hypothetical protein